MREYLLTMALLLAPAAFADDLAAGSSNNFLAAYDDNVRKAYEKESKSQCLARARRTLDEIVVCGNVERNDRFRYRKSGTLRLDDVYVVSPAERWLGVERQITQSRSAIGTGYTSSLADIEPGYVRRGFDVATRLAKGQDMVTNSFKGVDPDLE